MVDEVALIALIQDWTGCSDSDAVHTTKEVLKFFAGQADAVAPFGHYFRDMEGNQHFHTGAVVPPFAQSEITPLYATPPAAMPVDALRELAGRWREEASPTAARLLHPDACDALYDAANELEALIAATKEAGNG